MNDTAAKFLPSIHFVTEKPTENSKEVLEKLLQKNLDKDNNLRERFLVLFKNRSLTSID